MAMTQTQIDEAFAAMGLAPPSSALLASLEAIPNTYTALATIIQLPQVQTSVTPIVTMFDLALGHDPTSATLSSMVQSNLSQAQLASDFVSSQAFANVYNGGVLLNPNTVVTTANESIITALFVNGLGHPPTSATLSGFLGLTLSQAFLEFSQSQAAGISPIVDSSLTQILELATGISPQSNPPTPQDFTLTVGQDSVISGQNTVATTTPGVLVQSTGAVTVNAPLGGVFGNQPTLTPGDIVNLAGTGNTLNVGFDGSDILTAMTIKGAQSWNVANAGGGGILIEGTPGSIDGVTSLSYAGNGLVSSFFEVGAAGAGIDATTPASGFNFAVSNTPAGTAGVVFASAAFTGGDVINVTATAVGNTLTGTSKAFGTATDIMAGSGGANGFATWSVTSQGANSVNDIALNSLGSTKATTLNVTDDGSTTIIWAGAGGADWANLSTINAVLTSGALTITGGESGGAGLLSSDTTALTDVQGGSGADLFDMSSYAGTTAEVKGLSVNGGGNAGTVVELSNTEINTISGVASGAFASWGGVPTLADVSSGGLGGNVNMADFPGTGTLTFLSSTSGTSGATFTSNLNVTNGPADFTVMFNEQSWNGKTFTISGATGGAMLTMDLSDIGAPASVTTNGYPIVDLVLPHNGAGTFVFGSPYTTTFTDNTSGATPTLNISDAAGATAANADDLVLGNIDFPGEVSGLIGISTVSINDPGATSTTINADNIGRLLLGATNVTNINAQGTSHLVMDLPDTGGGVSGNDVNSDNPVLFHGVDVFGSNNGSNLLQGSSGPVALDAAGNGFIGGVAADTINAGHAGGDNIFGEGGNDIINLGAHVAADKVWIGTYDASDPPAAPGTMFHQAITDINPAIQGGNEIGANGYLGSISAVTTINGYVNGATGDQINFSVGDWASGTLGSGAVDYGLLAASGAPIGAGTSTMQLVTAPGTAVPTQEVVLDGITTYANAAQLQSQLAIATVGDIGLAPTGTLGAGDIFHVLMAYSTGTQIDIADVSIMNTTGAAISGIDTAKAGLSITVHDLVDITGISNLGLLNPHDITFTA